MVSEVNCSPPGPSPVIEQKSNQVKPATQTNPPVATTQATSDTVTLTDIGSRIDALAKSVEDTPITDSAKVSQLRDAIESGNYQVDAEVVAEKFNAIEQILSAPGGKK